MYVYVRSMSVSIVCGSDSSLPEEGELSDTIRTEQAVVPLHTESRMAARAAVTFAAGDKRMATWVVSLRPRKMNVPDRSASETRSSIAFKMAIANGPEGGSL